MKRFSYVLTRSVAPHARLMGKLVQEASCFSSVISVRSGAASVVLRKVSDMLGMSLSSGNLITVTVEGRDEEAAVAAIQNYVVANF